VRIFVTGASGWIGTPVVAGLVADGHQVLGLARSDEAAEQIAAAGAQAHRGDLDDLASLRAGAAACEGVIHLGYNHDFSRIEAAAATDLAAIEALGEVLEGTGQPLLIASGVAGLKVGAVATERDVPDPGSHPRIASAEAALALASNGVRSVVVRFAPTVHGAGDHGFIATLVGIARARGVAGYIGAGDNRWPAVHRFDAADLVRLAVTDAPAGSVLHAVAEEGVATRSIAEAIGRGLGLPADSVAPDVADEHFGWLARFYGMDVPASNTATRELLGWDPVQLGLLGDLDAGSYFGG
jgi:nucleoside-diphosphate-sugar epimerase